MTSIFLAFFFLKYFFKTSLINTTELNRFTLLHSHRQYLHEVSLNGNKLIKLTFFCSYTLSISISLSLFHSLFFFTTVSYRFLWIHYESPQTFIPEEKKKTEREQNRIFSITYVNQWNKGHTRIIIKKWKVQDNEDIRNNYWSEVTVFFKENCFKRDFSEGTWQGPAQQQKEKISIKTFFQFRINFSRTIKCWYPKDFSRSSTDTLLWKCRGRWKNCKIHFFVALINP